MFAKGPIAARDDESSPHLRGHVWPKSEAGTTEEVAPSNVIALRRGEAGPQELEARLRDAFDRALGDRLAAAKAIAAAVRQDTVTDAQTVQMQVVADVLT